MNASFAVPAKQTEEGTDDVLDGQHLARRRTHS